MKGVIFAIALLLCSCGSSGNRYIIEGSTSKSDGEYYYLFSGMDVVDSAVVTAGHYHFEGVVDSLIPIRNIGSTNLSDPYKMTRFTPVILESGTVTVIEDDNSPTGGLVVSGTKGNNALRQFVIKGTELQERGKEAFSAEERMAVNSAYDELVDKTIRKNLNNFTSVYLLTLSGERYTAEQKQRFISRLSPAMQQTKAAVELKRSLQTTKID